MKVCGSRTRPAARRGRSALRRAGRRTSCCGRRQVPAPRQLVGDLEADVVAGRRRSSGPGLPSPTIEDAVAALRRSLGVDGGGTSDRGYSPSDSPESPSSPPSAASPSPSPSSPTSSVSSSTSGSGSSSTRGGERVAIVTSSGSSATNVTPLGALHRGELKGVVDLHRGDVDDDAVGDVGRQRFDRDLAGDVLEHAAVFDAGGVLGALELDRDLGLDRLVELHLLQVDVLEAAADRVQLLLLDDDRDGFAALDLEVEERVALADDVRTSRSATWNGGRLRAAGVDDAGHQPVAAQAAGGAGAELRAGSDLQG